MGDGKIAPLPNLRRKPATEKTMTAMVRSMRESARVVEPAAVLGPKLVSKGIGVLVLPHSPLQKSATERITTATVKSMKCLRTVPVSAIGEFVIKSAVPGNVESALFAKTDFAFRDRAILLVPVEKFAN